MKPIKLEEWDTSPRVTPIVTDQDALLILRESCFRVRRFETFLTRLTISRSQLEEKLCKLVEGGLLRPIEPGRDSGYCEYILTPDGFDFLPIALSILRLRGEHNAARRRGSGAKRIDRTVFDGIMTCRDCGEVVADESGPCA